MIDWADLTMPQRDEIMRRYTAEGVDAAVSGGGVAQCPYRNDSQEATWWRRGFGNAKLGADLGNQRQST